MSNLSANCFLQTFKKLQGGEHITVDVYELFESDKDIKHETLLDEDIIRAVTDVVQYEDDPDYDPVEVDIAKIPHMKVIKALELALRYVEQRLTASSVKLMRLKR